MFTFMLTFAMLSVIKLSVVIPRASLPNTTTSNINGLYYKHMTIVNYASIIVNKLGASLTDDARVIIYDRHMFIVQATD